MKIVGLITEYNPFHNGHQYHIQKSLEVTGADAAIVVMSGDYVQRGTPAIMPKHLRAEMALKCGACAVFELPVCYATATAELFALGAVSFLDQLGVVDYLCFGSECNDLDGLTKIADILCDEPDEYTKFLKENLRAGMSFPAARQDALSSYMGISDCSFLLSDPNNILSIGIATCEKQDTAVYYQAHGIRLPRSDAALYLQFGFCYPFSPCILEFCTPDTAGYRRDFRKYTIFQYFK